MYLYWIHLPFHTDPFLEGYVGVTNDLERRKDEHFRKTMRFPPGSVMTLIKKCEDLESAQCLEFYLRPSWYIGWNIAQGGQDGNRPPGINTSGWTHSEESKKLRSARLKGNTNPSKETIFDGVTFSQQKHAAEYISKKYNVAITRALKFLRGHYTLETLLVDQRKFNGDGSLFNGHRGKHWETKKSRSTDRPKTDS